MDFSRVYFSIAVAFALASGGCASTPAPQVVHGPSQQAGQAKLTAAQHWGAVAADVAAQTRRTLAANPFLDGRALYVATSDLPFGQAFSNFMITALVEAGLPVSTQPEGAVEIRYETQLIRHKVELDPRKKGYVPGAPGRVGVNFWVMRNAPQAGTPDPAPDAASRERLWPTSVELVVTTSIVEADQYLQRTTDAYYIEQADADLFRNERNYREWSVAPQ